ncbi:MAG: hypothetical protein PHU42_02960 [Patescibacteria group bacterium]|nr:hypothetical protein [Patescibacteria group bacterium]
MEKENDNLKEEVIEIKEEVEDIKEEVVEIKEEVAEAVTESKKEKKSILVYIIVLVLVVAAAVVTILDYPKISSYAKNKINPYGFDYNYKKIKEYDWDTILTEKKIANIWNTSRKNINSAKNPDWSWILEDPKQFVDEAKCVPVLDEDILDQENQDKKSLMGVTITLCKNINEAKDTFTSQKDEIKNISQTETTMTLKSLKDTKGLGNGGYVYSIEKANSAEGAASDQYSGTTFQEGPFIITISESDRQGTYNLFSEDMESKIAKNLDKKLRELLAWY